MKIDHIGIAVQDIESAAALYTQGLGLKLERTETVSEQGVRVGFIPVGESEVELLEPVDANGTVSRFLANHGEGIHHLCIEVEDIAATMAQLREQGARLLSKEPTRGAGNSLVAFVHPKSANGVLLELVQKRER